MRLDHFSSLLSYLPFSSSVFLIVKVHIHWKRLLVFLSLKYKTKNMTVSKEYCLGWTFYLGKSTGACFLSHSSKRLNIWLVLWMISLLYCEIFITIHLHSSGWSCSLFFPLTCVLIEVKKPFNPSSSAVCVFLFLGTIGFAGAVVTFSLANMLRSLCLLFCEF